MAKMAALFDILGMLVAFYINPIFVIAVPVIILFILFVAYPGCTHARCSMQAAYVVFVISILTIILMTPFLPA